MPPPSTGTRSGPAGSSPARRVRAERSIGRLGIPAASLVAISIILATIGLPAEGIGLILAVDRILDMMRTSTNVFSDSCGAVIIGKMQGEEGVLSNNSK